MGAAGATSAMPCQGNATRGGGMSKRSHPVAHAIRSPKTQPGRSTCIGSLGRSHLGAVGRTRRAGFVADSVALAVVVRDRELVEVDAFEAARVDGHHRLTVGAGA